MATYFTSDQHIGHRNIIRYSDRPFADVDEMAREIIQRHNAVVTQDDETWHLGDFSLDEKLVKPTLSQLNGKHYLVMGNHDRCHPVLKKIATKIQKYIDYGFSDVMLETTMGPFLITHMPYAKQEGTSAHAERHSQYRPNDTGQWLLHGHVHKLWKIKDRMINVGVDVWNFTPVPYSTLIGMIQDK